MGGNELYVGAPYFAGMAALHTGVDLVSIYTANEATIPIKSLSPDLMVQSIYRASDLPSNWKDESNSKTPNINNNNNTTTTTTADLTKEPMVQRIVNQTLQYLQERRIHCVVIGPGMGRHPIIMAAMAQIVQHLHNQLYLILDADALYMLSLPQYRHILRGNHKVILTPNRMEYQRLFINTTTGSNENDNDDYDDPFDSVVVVEKGFVDRIYYQNHSRKDGPDDKSSQKSSYTCTELGGMKRCGGLGDVLAGTMAALVTWHVLLQQQQQQQQQVDVSSSNQHNNHDHNNNNNDSNLGTDPDRNMVVLSCYAACCLVKRATKKAYDTKHRAMLAQDVIDMIGPTFHEMMMIVQNDSLPKI
jgi:ATP-dependent NAD(P)H-hydrate dehydratase